MSVHAYTVGMCTGTVLAQECCGWDVVVMMHCREDDPPQLLQVMSSHCR